MDRNELYSVTYTIHYELENPSDLLVKNLSQTVASRLLGEATERWRVRRRGTVKGFHHHIFPFRLCSRLIL